MSVAPPLSRASEPPLLLRAYRGEPVERTPVWFMRQAGRCLPEYRALRRGAGLLEICRRPQLAAEATLQPVRRLNVDAAILFSDITLPLVAVGIDLEIVPGVGPVIAQPVRGEADLRRLRTFDPAEDMPYLAEAVRLALAELRVPLIGFAGGPFTLASYLIEGGPSKTHSRTRQMMYGAPSLWASLLERLADIAGACLRAQVQAGAQAVQVFESWAGALDPRSYRDFVLPAARRVFDAVADLNVPAVHFGVGTGELLELLALAGADVVGIDWHVPLDRARQRLGARVPVQGNLDPALCLAPWPTVREHVTEVLRQGGGAGHVFNLGHGVLPQTSPEMLAQIVAHVQEHSGPAAAPSPADIDPADLDPADAGPGTRPRRRTPAAGRTSATAERSRVGGRPREQIGVLLMAYGTPADASDIERYYTHIRRGHPPAREQLDELVRRYQAIGGGSPLLRICTEQAAALQAQLDARHDGLFDVVLGMKHSSPFIEDAVETLVERGVEHGVGLVLAPHYSSLSIDEYVVRALKAARERLRLSFIEDWHLLDAYIDALADRVRAAMLRFPAEVHSRVEVIFTAHSLPERILQSGDPYPLQLAETAEAVARRCDLSRFSTGWQSAGATHERWLGPDLATVLYRLASSGRAGVLVCPAGFTSDHLEILYDLDVECRRLARDIGLLWARTESLNADPELMAGLAGLVCDRVDARVA